MSFLEWDFELTVTLASEKCTISILSYSFKSSPGSYLERQLHIISCNFSLIWGFLFNVIHKVMRVPWGGVSQLGYCPDAYRLQFAPVTKFFLVRINWCTCRKSLLLVWYQNSWLQFDNEPWRLLDDNIPAPYRRVVSYQFPSHTW